MSGQHFDMILKTSTRKDNSPFVNKVAPMMYMSMISEPNSISVVLDYLLVLGIGVEEVHDDAAVVGHTRDPDLGADLLHNRVRKRVHHLEHSSIDSELGPSFPVSFMYPMSAMISTSSSVGIKGFIIASMASSSSYSMELFFKFVALSLNAVMAWIVSWLVFPVRVGIIVVFMFEVMVWFCIAFESKNTPLPAGRRKRPVLVSNLCFFK
ncbi:hypothetical protein B0A48_18399 [Cryoendolithus antarcticus]|uniref:Uncharacterized protein n=1 Tax=Cryoendolithus antarcticus TaxID=1507870 RepID=A0A1V8S8Q2_9PEZI|nr:hypothetical protein B0A48_18399 [Cryoendolithus antarcticus]